MGEARRSSLVALDKYAVDGLRNAECQQVAEYFILERSRASGFELAVNLVISVYWAVNLSSPVVLDRPFGRIVLSDLWVYFFWGFLALAVANAAVTCASLLHPYWTACRAIWRLSLDAARGALFCWLLTANIVASIGFPGLSLEKAQDPVNSVNLWAARSVPAVALVGTAILIVVNGFRI